MGGRGEIMQAVVLAVRHGAASARADEEDPGRTGRWREAA